MLSHSERLRTQREFEQVFERGRSMANRFLVLYRLRVGGPADPLKVGFSVSRRLGGAVVRNRIKRRLREVVRSLRPWMRGGVHLVFIARQGAENARYDALRDAALQLLKRGDLLLADPPDARPDKEGTDG